MADVSDKMDDFFARKDKKKGKSKKGQTFLTSEELARELEQSAKEREQSKKLPAKIEEEKEQQIAKQEVSADSETSDGHQSLYLLPVLERRRMELVPRRETYWFV